MRVAPAQPVTDTGLRSASFVFRHRTGNAVIFLVLIVAAAQLFNLQVPRAAGLRAEAAGQLKVTDVDKAVRGSIVDRNNDKLAFTIEARALTFQPVKIRKQLAEARQKTPEAPDPERRLRDIAAEVASRLNNKPDAKTVLKKLKSNESFVYLARAVDPAIAEAISKKFPEVGSERQDLRQYPGGVAGGQHRRRHRLGRPRAARPRGLAGRHAGRHRRVGHLRPRLRRRGDPRQLPQPAHRRQRVHRPADPRRRHPVLRPAAGSAGQGRLRRGEPLRGRAGRENR